LIHPPFRDTISDVCLLLYQSAIPTPDAVMTETLPFEIIAFVNDDISRPRFARHYHPSFLVLLQDFVTTHIARPLACVRESNGLLGYLQSNEDDIEMTNQIGTSEVDSIPLFKVEYFLDLCAEKFIALNAVKGTSCSGY
jgi:hypothetical protein